MGFEKRTEVWDPVDFFPKDKQTSKSKTKYSPVILKILRILQVE